MRLLLLILVALPVFGAPVWQAGSTTCFAQGPSSVTCGGITDIAGTHLVKARVGATGSYTINCTRNAAIPNSTVHSVTCGGLAASTLYGLLLCSTNAGETCTSEFTITTSAASTQVDPLPPDPPDTSWESNAGTGSTLTVNANCQDASTGLYHRVTTDATNTAKIVIPRSGTETAACSGVLFIVPPSVTDVLVTSDCPSSLRPPAGVRDSADWCHANIYRAYYNMLESSVADVAALTGNVDLDIYGPGTLVYANDSGNTFVVKKAALSGVGIAVTNATNATPIVITAANHGFSNGQTVCLDSVGGNRAADGCYIAANVATNTLQLNLRGGTPQAGSAAYTSGGVLWGLTWTTVTATANAGPLVGTCPASRAWGYDSNKTDAFAGMYRCGTDLKWYKITNKSEQGTDTDGTPFQAAVNAQVGSSRWKFDGINFAEAPIAPEPEFAYGPLYYPGSVLVGTAGSVVGGVFNGWRNTSKFIFNQIMAPSDITSWHTWTQFWGYTSDVVIRDSGAVECALYSVQYMPEPERSCRGIDFTSSPGRHSFTNTYWHIGGWALFYQEAATTVKTENVRFDTNSVKGVLDLACGSAAYNQPATTTQPKCQVVRQLFELKQGGKFSIQGNTWDGLAYSVSPAAAAITVGTQNGQVYFSSIDAGGVLVGSNRNPLPIDAAADQRVLLKENGTNTAGVYKIASNVANVITLKNLDNSAWSAGALGVLAIATLDLGWQLHDIDIRNNTFTNLGVGVSAFGDTYEPTYDLLVQPGPFNRLRIANNSLTLSQIGTYGGACGIIPTTCNVNLLQMSGLVDNIQIDNNAAQVAAGTPSTNQGAFLGISNSLTIQGFNLLARNNLLNAEKYGIQDGDDSTVGITFLNRRYPQGWLFTPNAMVRSGGSIANQPAGTVFPTVAAVKFLPSGQLQYSSPYLAYGINIAALTQAQGLILNPRVRVGSSQIVVQFTGPVSGAHYSVESSTDGGTTWTRVTTTASNYQQVASIAASAGIVYDVRILGPSAITSLGKFRTP